VREPAGFDIRDAAHECGVECGKSAVPFLEQPQGPADDFAGLIVTATGKLCLDKAFEVSAERATCN